MVLGDVDGNGDLDLIAGNYTQTNKLYLNDAIGGFSASGTAVGSETDETQSVVLGDVDGDGDLDLIAGNYGQTNKLYLNNGIGGFSTDGIDIGSETDETRSVVLGDVDGDGDLDLIAGNRGQTNKLYLNDGIGGFPTVSNIGSETDLTVSVVLGDVDSDGDLDLVVGNWTQTNKLYMNDGSGGFSASASSLGSETDDTISVVLGDVDGDGDGDLVVGNQNQTNKLYSQIAFLTHGQTVVSKTVNTGESVSAAALIATASVNTSVTRNTAIDYFLSNDGGARWYRVYSGQVLTFPSPGTDLRWKAELSSLSPVRTPVLQQIFIDQDTDQDGIINSVDADDDNDGLSDIVENQLGTDPLVFNDQSQPLVGTGIDSDGDGLSDDYELNDGDPTTDPNVFNVGTSLDTDGDGLVDTVDIDPGTYTEYNIGPLGDMNGDGNLNAGDSVLHQQLILSQ